MYINKVKCVDACEVFNAREQDNLSMLSTVSFGDADFTLVKAEWLKNEYLEHFSADPDDESFLSLLTQNKLDILDIDGIYINLER